MKFYQDIKGALFQPDFYRAAAQESLTRGMLYLIKWAVLFSFLFSFFIAVRVYPEARSFLNWVEGTMPPVQWTPEGLRMSQKSPYEMKHPKYGHFATLNMDKKEITAEEMGDAMIYVTAANIYVREKQKQGLRVYSVLPPAGAKVQRGNMVIDAALLRGLEKNARPALAAFALLLAFSSFFIWKLLGAFFYSTIGMLINLFREEKLSYAAVLNISFFAMTASTVLQLLFTALAVWVKVPFGLWGSLIVTTGYLYAAIKMTEDTSAGGPFEGNTLPVS